MKTYVDKTGWLATEVKASMLLFILPGLEITLTRFFTMTSTPTATFTTPAAISN